jgi:type II secretory pathway component GspD/PulD (secretin)
MHFTLRPLLTLWFVLIPWAAAQTDLDHRLDQAVSIVGNPDLTLSEGLRVLASSVDVPLVQQDVPDVPLNVAVREPRPFRTVLDLIADLNELTWYVRDGFLVVTRTIEALPGEGAEPQVRTFEVDRAAEVAERLRSEYPEATIDVDPSTQGLLVQAPPDTMPSIASAVERLETTVAALPQPLTRLVDLQGVRADADVFLQAVDPRIELTDLEAIGLVQVRYPASQEEAVLDVLGRLEALRPTVRRYDLNHTRATAITEAVTNTLSDLGLTASVTTHDSRNAMFVTTSPSGHARVERLLQEFDQEQAQVRVRVRIYEILQTQAEALGLDFTSGVGIFEGGFSEQLTGLAFGQPTTLTPFTITGTLNTLVEQNMARNVDDANLIVQNDTTAEFNSGGSLQIVSAPNSDGERNTLSVNFGTLINLRPLIANDGTVNLEFDVSLSDFTGELRGLSGLRLTQKRISNTVNVRDGSVVVAGGLLQTDESAGEQGIPVLKDIPLLGGLFRSTDVASSRSDLIITLEVNVEPPTIPNP